MTFKTEHNLGDRIKAKDPSLAKPEVFVVGQIRVTTISGLVLTEYRSSAVGPGGGYVTGKWYPERWVLGKV